MRRYKKMMLVACGLCLSAMLHAQGDAPFWLGADISGTTELEARGVRLCNAQGEPRENTALMKELGLNAIRLRVWVNPTEHGGFCDMNDVLCMALRAKTLQMPVMIDFHYSDWWADPGQQNPPAAWRDMDFGQMKQAVALHTRQTLRLLMDNGIDVRWVQVGNETTHGMLWPMGRAEDYMQQYVGLTQAGCEAVRQVCPQAAIVIHLDGGCDPVRFNFIFDGLRRYGCQWDIIGMSVYPYWDIKAGLTTTWQQTVERFTANINALYDKYHTPLMVVETGVERAKPVEGKQILAAIIDAARHRTNGHCLGVFYWAPELEGHYELGAFQDHRPTAIMEAFTESK